MPKRIAIVSPEGERLFVDEEEAPKALAEGYHQPTEEERRLYAADESPGKAFLQGVARGVLPTADEVQVAGGENPKNLKALKEANPWASGLGELGGFIGGSALIPEAKAEAGATGLAKVAPGFVKPLIEGGLAGLEQTVSEATLDDKPVLAEDLGKNILTSALEFGAFHGALKSLGWAGSKLLKSVRGVPVEKALEASMPEAERILLTPEMAAKPMPLTPEMELGAIERADTVGSPVKMSAKDAEDFWQPGGVLPGKDVGPQTSIDLIEQLRILGAEKPPTVDMRAISGEPAFKAASQEELDAAWKASEYAKKEMVDAGVPAESLKDPQNWFGQKADELAFGQLAMKSDLNRNGLYERWRPVMASGREYSIFGEGGKIGLNNTVEKVNERASAAAEKLQGDVLSKLNDGVRFDAQKAVDSIESKLLAGEEKAGNDIAANYVRGRLEKLVEHNDGSFENAFDVHNTWRKIVGQSEPTGAKDLLFKARKLLRDEIADQLTAQGGNGEEFQKLLKDYGNLRAIEDLSERRMKGQLGNRTFGMSDFFGGNMGSNIGGLPGALVGGAAAHVLKDRGGFLMSAALDKLGDSRFAKNAAKGLAALLEQKLDTVPQLFGPLLPALQTAAAKGGNELLKAHLEAAKGPHGDDYLAVMGLDKGGPDGARYGLARAHVIGQMEAHADEQRARMLKVFKNVGEHAAPAYKIYTAKQLKKDTDALKTLMMSPDELSKHLPTDSAMYPETTTGAVTTTQVAVQFLGSKAPKDPNEGLPPAFHTRWEPSKAELDTYSQYVTAVKDPMGAAARMLKGQNIQATVETLQTVYPGTWAALQREAMNRLSEQTKPLAYRQRLALEPLLGPDVFGISPAAFKYLQTPQEPESPKGGSGSGGGGGGGGDGRQKVDLQKNLETQAQRTEAR